MKSDDKSVGSVPYAVQLEEMSKDDPPVRSPEPKIDEDVEFEESRNYATSMSIVLLIVVIITVLDFVSDYKVYEELVDIETILRGNSTLVNNPANVGPTLLKYNEIALNSSTEYCDVPYFANGGDKKLFDTFSTLRSASLTMIWVSVLPLLLHLLYKAFVVYDLWHPFNLDFDSSREATRDGGFDPVANPVLPFKGLLMTGNNKQRRRYRKQRTHLRSETFFFFLAQLTQDIPQMMIALLFIVFSQTNRGFTCLKCFAEGNVCEVPSLFENINPAVVFSVVMIIISVLFNGVNLAERWHHFDQKKREYQDLDPNATKSFFVTVLTVLSYFASVTTPVLALVYFYIGPEVYDFTEESLLPIRILLIIGGLFWVFGCCSCVFICGVEAGESACATCILCEVCEVCNIWNEICSYCEVPCCCCCC